jgi:hypothetical protein
MSLCSIAGCSAKSHARSWCMKHYQRWRHHGDPLKRVTLRGADPRLRFLQKVVRSDDCLLWTGSLDTSGYGNFFMDGANILAHRASYLLFVGPFDQSLDIDHLCAVIRCVEPTHLEPVTHAENIRRRYAVTRSRATRGAA